jgi:hypothetical protein
MITPEQLAGTSEASQQTALFCWLAQAAKTQPLYRYAYHIPNGGSRGDTADSRQIAGGNMKKEGVKKGVPDIHFPIARHGKHGLWIEMKKPSLRPKRPTSPIGTSEDQDEWIALLKAQGHAVCVCYDWEEARKVFEYYMKDG